jgi:hypothetical protein
MAELSTPVRGVLPATDTALSGVGQIGYGVVVGSSGANEDWLVEGGTQGGIWTLTAPANTWARRGDLDTSGEFANMPSVRVREGNQGVAGSVWYYDGPSAPTIGSTLLTWTLGAYGRPTLAGVGLENNLPYIQLPDSGVIEGMYGTDPFYDIDQHGLITDVGINVGTYDHIYGAVPFRRSDASPTIADIFGGSTYVAEEGEVLNVPTSTIGGGLVASTMYHFYVQYGGESGQGVVVRTTTGATFVFNEGFNARYQDGDFDDRYIGALRTDASGNYFRQQTLGLGSELLVSYLENMAASPFLVVSGGTATSAQTVNLGPSGLKLVSPTCQRVHLSVGVNSSSSVALDDGSLGTLSFTNYLRRVTTTERGKDIWLPLDSSQSFRWINAAGGGSTDISVLGYIDRR